jgi:ABC-type branched-subunit amino acid transport system substrate-binding protein/predicted negative regulator of RcsB-dependent stress response
MNNRWCRQALVGLMMAVVVCSACAPRPKVGLAPTPKTRAEADQLFQQAEKKYQASAFPEALALYADFLARYPDEPLAPAALMRIGGIHAQQGNSAQARKAYSQLVADYPNSPQRPEAMLEVLSLLLREGKSAEVVSQSPEVLRSVSIGPQQARALVLTGDAHTALGANLPAVEAYTRALRLAAPSEQDLIVPKLRAAILRLASAEVKTLAARPADDIPMDYLLFQAGMVMGRERRTSEALVLLRSFLQRYPDHENAERAQQAMADLGAAARPERRVVGSLLPLSGAYQAIGQRALRGIELAVSLHNSDSAAPPMQVIVKDTASEAQATLLAMRELDREGVSAVIGPLVHAEAVVHEAQALGLPIVTITQKEGVVGVGDHVFRNFITPAAQVRALVAYATARLGITQAIILYPDEAYGRTFMGLFRDEFQARGGEVLLAAAYAPSATDFSASIKKLLRFSQRVSREARPDRTDSRAGSRRSRTDEKEYDLVFEFQAIFIPDEPAKAGMLVPQLVYHDIRDVHLLGTNLWHSDTLIQHAGPYAQGAIMPDAFSADSTEPAARRFVDAFEQTYQQKPGAIEAAAYDTTRMLFDVLSRPGVRFRGDVAAELRTAEGFPGATGFTRFLPNGDCDKELRILEVRGKRFVELK